MKEESQPSTKMCNLKYKDLQLLLARNLSKKKQKQLRSGRRPSV